MEQDCLALLFASVVENVNSKILFMKNVRVFYFRNYVPIESENKRFRGYRILRVEKIQGDLLL